MRNPLINLLIEIGAKGVSSIMKAYSKTIKNSGGAAAGGSSSAGSE